MKKRSKPIDATGMNLKEALLLAAELGFRIRHIRQSGELLVFHPYFARPTAGLPALTVASH